MKKKFKYFLIAMFFFFLNINVVSADNCAEIEEKIQNYNNYKTQLEALDCTDTSNSDTVVNCNNFNVRKNIVVTQLMKLNDEGNICESKQDEVDAIIEENEDNCGQIFDDTFNDFVNGIMVMFYILGPILLLLFGSLDFAKATVSSEQDALRKASKNFAKRVAALVLLFVSPALVNYIISLNISDKYLSGNAYTCNYKYTVFNKEYNITYVPINNSSTSSRSLGTITIGGITSDEEAAALQNELTASLNTTIHSRNSINQNGPFPKYWSSPYNLLSKFQCTWWANGRASQYLEQNGTKYKKYPTQMGNGGEYYAINKKNGWFNYGTAPKPNSIVSWSKSGGYGHVAYVEGVTSNYIYISHAGSGKSWFGVQKIPIDGSIWSGYTLNGYIYLDEPL